jgi:hypothetical protein
MTQWSYFRGNFTVRADISEVIESWTCNDRIRDWFDYSNRNTLLCGGGGERGDGGTWSLRGNGKTVDWRQGGWIGGKGAV